MALAGPFTQKEHMSTQQPEALRLAEILELGSRQFNNEASTELRRLHALNAELLEALIWYVSEDDVDGRPGNEFWLDGKARAEAVIAKAEGREA